MKSLATPTFALLVLTALAAMAGCDPQSGASTKQEAAKPEQGEGEAKGEGEDEGEGEGEGEAKGEGETKDERASDADADAEAQAAEQKGTLVAARERSKVGFAVAKATVGHLAHFEDYDARMEFDERVPQRLEVSVKMASVVADRRGLTQHLQSADFFDVATFPTSSFSSTQIQAQPEEGATAYLVEGTMRLHGTKRELKFPANIEWTEAEVRAQANLEISAAAFGIAYAGMEAELASDLVSLEIELVFPRVAADAPRAHP